MKDNLNINSSAQKLEHRLKNSLTVRLMMIGVLIMILMIPIVIVQGLIREREHRQSEVVTEVSSKWGNAQTIKGLVLTVPYTVYVKVYDKEKPDVYKLEKATEYAHFLPDSLTIAGKITPEVRYRSIFEVVVYKAALTLNGQFSPPDFSNWNIEDKDILWKEAEISLGLSDLRGIQDGVNLKWGNENLSFSPGTSQQQVIQTGIHTRVPLASLKQKTAIPYSLKLAFNGSSSLNFIPLGKQTDVQLEAPWGDPGFDGAFLPENRQIDAQHFSAKWNVLHLNRSYPQQFRGSVEGIDESAFGVNLVVPVDEYQKSTRSAKYAILIISLTFLVFFFIQILNGIRLHPIQYLLVGFALCVFYTLLVSISEHLNFQWAYLIAALATVGLITAYTAAMFKQGLLTAITAGILGVLYIYLYIIIQLQDYALLMGSVGLFLVLAIVMYLSRNIDWYGLEK